ncbi:dephospho-CoA kinase [Oceanisphaera arctica]|uniref:Dephospho-CoA kinase n=1 Tax=Oceanisphaera arctica TaxID=641510 RepID=A0A2P5TNE3_9GAMM|nr:dephospho-CoA kinase [Oceanisphaera arctica]PPL17096.1 dephospho-CoA kinase [Oceanisphaera arctica]GHA04240.1 dephospho-CoA kinase [Oceanisphaera arctica]
MTYIVGLTGGIGSGKSTVADFFAELGVEVVDADIIAREVVAPGEPALAAIATRFGLGVIAEDGSLNRRELRQRVFGNPAEKDWLNALLHPLIREHMISACAAARSPYCLLVVPLLVENKLTNLCQRVLVVDVSAEQQLARTTLRDQADAAQIRAIMAAQASREQRLAAADDVIDNKDSDFERIKAEVNRLHRQYLALAGAL